jgi:hypothetical protein
MVQLWCTENYKKINILETNMISFSHKTNCMHFNHCVVDVLVVYSDYIIWWRWWQSKDNDNGGGRSNNTAQWRWLVT